MTKQERLANLIQLDKNDKEKRENIDFRRNFIDDGVGIDYRENPDGTLELIEHKFEGTIEE